MSTWAVVFWIWIALDVGFVLGWMYRSWLEPRLEPGGRVDALITAATNARNVLEMNLDLFEGEESSDHRDSEEEATSVGNALSDALQPFELPCPLSVLVEEDKHTSQEHQHE
jgi:hypothetical protein